MITAIIVDDHPIVRAGMRTVLEAATDVTVVAEGSSGADALRLVQRHCPNVLVLDVNLPDLNGLQVTQQLRAQGVTTAILILSVHDDSQTVFGLLECGATGYVLKDEALETLVHAVRAAAQFCAAPSKGAPQFHPSRLPLSSPRARHRCSACWPRDSTTLPSLNV
jgi:DNA-binding NarL/FixJ family response regulator